jgi:hypothetical protein
MIRNRMDASTAPVRGWEGGLNPCDVCSCVRAGRKSLRAGHGPTVTWFGQPEFGQVLAGQCS